MAADLIQLTGFTGKGLVIDSNKISMVEKTNRSINNGIVASPVTETFNNKTGLTVSLTSDVEQADSIACTVTGRVESVTISGTPTTVQLDTTNIPSTATIVVKKNTVVQTETTDYTINRTTGLITFTSALANADVIETTLTGLSISVTPSSIDYLTNILTFGTTFGPTGNILNSNVSVVSAIAEAGSREYGMTITIGDIQRYFPYASQTARNTAYTNLTTYLDASITTTG